MANKPALVLVPGLSSIASLVYEPLIAQLKNLGFHQIEPINIPSMDAIATGALLKPTALEADIASIRLALLQLVEQDGLEVIVVAHSYGGTPALCACESLWKSQREGLNGGVIRACLLSSSLSLPEQSLAGVRAEWAQNNPEAGINDAGAKMETVGDEMFIIPEGFQYVWFSDLPAEEQDKWGATLKPGALSALITPIQKAAVSPKHWKLSYLVTTVQDPAMPEAFQKFLVQQAKDAGAHVDSYEMKSGHFVQISHAEEVAKWISEAR